MFVHIHGHSQFSLLEAIGSSKAIIGRLKELWFSHAPIMDYNGMYNVITHYEICKKEQMKPILGVDLAIHITLQWKTVTQSRYITLIAKNYEWYLTLLEVVSKAQTINGQTFPHLPLSQFPDMQNNIIAIVWAYDTPLGDMISMWRTNDDCAQLLKSYQEYFWQDNVFLEVIPQDPKYNEKLATANTTIWELHKQTNIPVIITSNFHYIHKSDKEAYDIARCIKDWKRVYDDDRRKTFGDFHITSVEETEAMCQKNGFTESQIATLCETTEQVAAMIDVEIPLHDLLFPVYESPEWIKELYEKFLQQ